MAKTKISDEHRKAAQATVDALAKCGVEATISEVLLASEISNAVETIVTLTSIGTDTIDPRPELDTPLARKLFDTGGDPLESAAVPIRTIALARGLLRARRTGASMERQAHELAQGLVECFAAMDLDRVRGSETVVAIDPPDA